MQKQKTSTPRDVLTPEALAMLQTIARSGSFAGAARELGMVPSALTYRVRQIEEALDVLLFDRRSRQARLTEAGLELLREGGRLLTEIDAMANRVKRIATGWEPRLTIAVDTVIDRTTVLELCEKFFALQPPTQLRLRHETLSGTLDTLITGQADLALGVLADAAPVAGLQVRTLGTPRFVFAVAPHHPLAREPEPLSDLLIRRHRMVAVADSIARGGGLTLGLLQEQEVFTVASMDAKLEAQARGLGVGFLPAGLAAPHVRAGRLLLRRVERAERELNLSYAWRRTGTPAPGRALAWWLQQCEHPATREALLGGDL
ncbi:LysR family transcriptional regulator [Noviherbaspirillum aridicola]|uniref:LysR family transcriptional regulator n=1 Tax=Noviherbaspirillum aridicola TaxID=2849687 RepID=A0ABQ4PZM5_9BURK|nr:LysR family transcriptional regulator [Noviherbaspirillum aridicola]GIZ50304.1 LysR family transcriptional regulator [Noviherbaspirillum aridicola]